MPRRRCCPALTKVPSGQTSAKQTPDSTSQRPELNPQEIPPTGVYVKRFPVFVPEGRVTVTQDFSPGTALWVNKRVPEARLSFSLQPYDLRFVLGEPQAAGHIAGIDNKIRQADYTRIVKARVVRDNHSAVGARKHLVIQWNAGKRPSPIDSSFGNEWVVIADIRATLE